MAIDSNHVTKLGELKSLIDGLWEKIKSSISTSTSGLLSKTDAANTYASKDSIPSTDNLLKIDGSNATEEGVSALINKLNTGSDDSQADDYFVSQYAGGGASNTTYYRRPVSKLWNFIKGQISSVLGLTATYYGGYSAGTYNSRSYDNNGADKLYVTSLTEKRATKVHYIYCNSTNYTTYGAPTSGWYVYETTGHADNDTYAIQTAQSYGGTRFYRSRYNGTWGAWKQVVNTGTSAVGSSTKPVYVDSSGNVQACGFSIVIGSTGTNTSTLYFV